METCQIGHTMIVYDGFRCPLCVSFEKIDDLRVQIRDLKDSLSDARSK